MKKGFSLVELIVVVGIIAVLATIGVSDYLNTRNRKHLESTAEVLVRELNFTMTRSRAQEDGYQWWIHLDNPAGDNDFYTVCYGTYTASAASCTLEGGTEFKRTSLGEGIEFTNPGPGVTKDVVFAKATGLSTATAPVTITISSTAGTGEITVNPSGGISVTF